MTSKWPAAFSLPPLAHTVTAGHGMVALVSVAASSFKILLAVLMCAAISSTLDHLDPGSGSGSSQRPGLCRSHDVYPGEWRKFNKSTKSFYCCDIVNGKYMPPEKQTLGDESQCGLAENSHFKNGSYNGWFNVPGTQVSCMCDIVSKSGRYGLSDRERYRYHPSVDCTILEWDAHKFCDALAGRALLLVGDSTMDQTFATLVNMILDPYRRQGSANNSCANQVIFGWSDFLALNHQQVIVDRNGHRDQERGRPASYYIQEVRPDIVIMSAGPHFQSVALFEEIMIKLAAELGGIRKTYGKPLTLGWKTQNPGHPHCYDHSVPFSNASELSYRDDKYAWHIHPELDKSAFSHWKEGPIVNLSPLYLRVDGHEGRVFNRDDCLHYCLPGPLDLFSQLIYTMLASKEL